ncbi:MAG: polysaccharide biosynthesis protein [Candidatus Eisenbacteria sp.]|nr:polysaccharide biosynthesis protein [Candidatus Eisenbacteria bacterium]
MGATLRRLGRNIRWLLLSEAVGRAIGFAYTALLARLLGLEGFGTLTLVLVYSEMFGLLVGFSFHEILIRDVARRQARLGPLLATMICLEAMLLIPALGLSALLGLAYGGILLKLLPLGVLYGGVRAIAQTFLAVPAAHEDFRPASVYKVLDRLAALAALLVLIAAGGSLVALFLALLAGACLTLSYPIRMAGRFGAFHGRQFLSLAEWKGLIREGASYSALRWITVVYNRVDMILLDRFLGAEAVGLYGAAYRLMEVFKLIPNMAERTLLPIVSRSTLDAVDLRRVLEGSLKALAAAAIPLALGAWALAPQGMRIVYGSEYGGAATAWAILMAGLVIICLSRPFLTLLRAEGRMRQASLLALTGVGVNVGLNIVFIPRWGILAAAFATGAAEIIFLASLWMACSKSVGRRALRGFLALAPAACGMALTVLLLGGRWPWIAGVGGVALYVAILFWGRGLDAEERRGLKELVRG